MTSKPDFTAEEWDLLQQSPFLVGLYVIFSDPSLTGMVREMTVLFKSVQEQPVPDKAQELVDALVVDIKHKVENDQQLPSWERTSDNDYKGGIDSLLDSIKEVVILVDTKANFSEAAGFMEWLFNIANAVAEEAREGGFLGMGGEKVSDKERTALKILKSTLKL